MKDLDTHTNGKNNLVIVKKEISWHPFLFSPWNSTHPPKIEVESDSDSSVWNRVEAVTLKVSLNQNSRLPVHIRIYQSHLQPAIRCCESEEYH